MAPTASAAGRHRTCRQQDQDEEKHLGDGHVATATHKPAAVPPAARTQNWIRRLLIPAFSASASIAPGHAATAHLMTSSGLATLAVVADSAGAAIVSIPFRFQAFGSTPASLQTSFAPIATTPAPRAQSHRRQQHATIARTATSYRVAVLEEARRRRVSSWFRSCPERHSPRPPEPQPSSSAVVQVHPTADLAGLRAPTPCWVWLAKSIEDPIRR